MTEYTTPPCENCNGHAALEKEVAVATVKNTKEHGDILTKLDKMAGDVKWMTIIGKWVLGTFVGYMIFIGYSIFTWDYATKKELKTVEDAVKEGDDNHNHNERAIAEILGKVDVLVHEVTGR